MDFRHTQSRFTQEKLDELFLNVLELPKETRPDWLHERCGGLQDVVDEILSLADAHERSGNFLDDSLPAVELALASESYGNFATDYSGLRVGQWQLDSVVGEGGMGRVYKAHRADGRYEQIVAVKVVPAVGFQNALFSRERQALADLNHPVITHILDAGEIPESTDAYFVMEFVDGTNIVEYINSHTNLKNVDKAELIITVLDALQLAHSQGVIHCDIKPDNLLVDKTGRVKLLDFGIAKFVDDSGDKPANEEVSGITPSYASPQRLTGSVPTSSDDIYGVGLLFGICMTQSPNEFLDNSVPLNRQQPVLAQSLNSELQSIFLRATNKQASDRYPTAAAFADDIKNWISHAPVVAHHGGFAYQLGKAFTRHRFLSTALTLLVLGLGVSLFAWHTHQQKILFEQTQRDQLNAALQLSKDISEGLDWRMSQLPGSLPLRMKTAETAITQIERIHALQPGNAAIKAALARAYLQLQSFYFQPSQLHIGDYAKGVSRLEKAYQLAYDSYHIKRTPKTLTLLIKATRRVSAHLMIIQRDWNSTSPFEHELNNEFQSLQVKDNLLRSAHRAQLYLLFRRHMLNKNYAKARSTLDEAMKLSNFSIDHFTDFQKDRVKIHESRLLELDAVYDMVTENRESARQKFQWIAGEFQENPIWRHRRRAVYAFRAIACLDMSGPNPDYVKAASSLKEARSVVQSLVDQFPSAVSLQWELREFIPLDQMMRATSDMSPVEQREWFNIFGCDDPMFLHMPAPPPGGWDSLDPDTLLSLKEKLKPLI